MLFQVLEKADSEFPELNHMFLRYKTLKKEIKKITASEAEHAGPVPSAGRPCAKR